MKRIILCLLALAMLALTGASADNGTQLQLTFIGMYATSDGSYRAVNLEGTFEVYHNGTLVGTVLADKNGSAPVNLSVSGNVQLVPVKGTIAPEIPVNEQGYTVSIVSGRTNYAPVVAYAQAGLFRVHTESQADFALISEVGEVVMTFSTDSKGDYALPVAIPAGQYTLRMEGASLAISRWRDKIINIVPYTGPDSVTMIDASYYYTPEITLRPATPTPVATATPTAAPTAAPATATPAQPTATPDPLAPTATPTPTPTPVPTATPVPTHGTLILQGLGDSGAVAGYSLSAGGVVYGEGELAAGDFVQIEGLEKGNYIVTISLQDHVLLTGLNGYPSLQRRAAQWLVSINAGRMSVYEVELSLAGSISGTLENMAGVPVSLTGSEIYNISADGAFACAGMVPDTYTVTCVLPEGNYTGEGWSFVDSAGQTLAIRQVMLEGGSGVVLPAIRQKEMGSVSGVVYDREGNPFAGVQVTLTDAAEQTVASAVTGADGRWSIGGVETGAYTVHYEGSSDAMLSAGAAIVTADAMHAELSVTEIVPASLRVRVFNDANNNGVLGKNEHFLPGAVISLIAREGEMDVVVASAVSDENGEAVLYAPAGAYILRCVLPEDYGYAQKGSKSLISNSGMELSIDRTQDATVTLTQGAQAEFGIGAMEMATLRGTVWHDLNGDGLWQAGEPGIPGMRITAEGTRNGLVYETFTDADGRFEIRQIRNGTYNICYHVPEGYVFTYKASGPRQQRSLMTTEADRVGKDQIVFDKGDVVDEQNVGLVTECVVEGVCFLDANYNGVFDEGEEVLPGVQVELFRQSNNKRLRTVISDENGVYRFGNIRQDVFKLKVILPTGYAFTIDVPGDPMGNQFPPRDGKREQSVLNIAATNGETTRVMVGVICHGSVSGVVYFDDNFSGAWERGEKIAAGIVVTLLNEQGEAVKTAKTNKNGSFTFGDLTPGVYRISVSPKDSYAFTTTGEGSVVANDGGLGISGDITVALGAEVTGMNAGMILPSKITGKVFADGNDNGLMDAGEKGLQGAIVTLISEEGEEITAEVGANGAYTFHPVLPGRYCLRYELPDGAIYAVQVPGGNQITDDGQGEWFDVGVSQTYQAPLCGGLYLGSISGCAFADTDGSGVQDAGEIRLAGMMLTLTPAREDLTERVVTTGEDGTFAMADLRPGVYTLTVSCPQGYVFSLLPGATLPLSHGVSEQSVTLEVGMGSAWTDEQLGCVKPASYTGMAWLDENLNGLFDAGERPAAGERVVMIEQRSGDVVAEMVTAEDGAFHVEGLAPGLYTIAYTTDDGVSGTPWGDSTFEEADGRLVMSDVQVTEGSQGSGAMLGLIRETKLEGHVWLDHDGEIRMVSGAQVTLMQDGTAVDEAVTGEDGLYAFVGLMPGDYAIHVTLPAGHLALEPSDRRIADGALISVLAANDGSNGQSGTITVCMAVDQLQLDIGSVKQGRLGDLCWLDENGNGLQDEGDGGIPGVEISLMRGGAVVATTVSDQYGYYVFEGIYPGEYTLAVVAPAQVKPTTMRTDMPMIVSVLQDNGESVLLPVESDGVNYDADLGFVLVKKGEYPAGYGEGATQDWTRIQ